MSSNRFVQFLVDRPLDQVVELIESDMDDSLGREVSSVYNLTGSERIAVDITRRLLLKMPTDDEVEHACLISGASPWMVFNIYESCREQMMTWPKTHLLNLLLEPTDENHTLFVSAMEHQPDAPDILKHPIAQNALAAVPSLTPKAEEWYTLDVLREHLEQEGVAVLCPQCRERMKHLRCSNCEENLEIDSAKFQRVLREFLATSPFKEPMLTLDILYQKTMGKEDQTPLHEALKREKAIKQFGGHHQTDMGFYWIGDDDKPLGSSDPDVTVEKCPSCGRMTAHNDDISLCRWCRHHKKRCDNEQFVINYLIQYGQIDSVKLLGIEAEAAGYSAGYTELHELAKKGFLIYGDRWSCDTYRINPAISKRLLDDLFLAHRIEHAILRAIREDDALSTNDIINNSSEDPELIREVWQLCENKRIETYKQAHEEFYEKLETRYETTNEMITQIEEEIANLMKRISATNGLFKKKERLSLSDEVKKKEERLTELKKKLAEIQKQQDTSPFQ